MIARDSLPSSISRRTLLTTPLSLLSWTLFQGDQEVGFERKTIQHVVPGRGLAPPLTLGLARVVLPSGAATWAATPGGARILVVESGGLEVTTTARDAAPISRADLAGVTAPPSLRDALFLPAGTAMPFGALGVVSLRNPGRRAAVILDAAVYPEEPRPLVRAFTTSDGVSFQLLANASAAAVPAGHSIVTLERFWLGPAAELPADARIGLVIMYLESGTLELQPIAGEVFAARAAASAPYAMPGSLQPLQRDTRRDATAGAVIFLPLGAEARIRNVSARKAAFLSLSVRDPGASVSRVT